MKDRLSAPLISRSSSAMVFNDMINANVRGGDAERTRLIEASGLISSSVQWVAELRRVGVPIFWVRVERRADGKDRAANVTDVSLRTPPAEPTVKGSFAAQNIAELPVEPDDHEILKPRYSPFTGTDLDLQLRARHVDTVLLGGISTNMGVESCARQAFDLGYNVVVLSDLCWSADQGKHEFSLRQSLPSFSRVLTTSETGTLLG